MADRKPIEHQLQRSLQFNDLVELLAQQVRSGTYTPHSIEYDRTVCTPETTIIYHGTTIEPTSTFKIDEEESRSLGIRTLQTVLSNTEHAYFVDIQNRSFAGYNSMRGTFQRFPIALLERKTHERPFYLEEGFPRKRRMHLHEDTGRLRLVYEERVEKEQLGLQCVEVLHVAGGITTTRLDDTLYRLVCSAAKDIPSHPRVLRPGFSAT